MKDAVGRIGSVFVLGGTSDIGVAAAKELISRGARRVVLAGRDQGALAEAAARIGRDGVDVETASFDAEATEGHEEFIASVFGARDVDVVVFAFGALGVQERDETRAAEALRVVRVNYVGAVSTAIPVAQRMREQGHGTMVILSSVAGERARRANFIYGSSKAGVDAFFQGLAHAVHGTGVHVLIVRPGFVRSKMTRGRPEAPFSTTPEAVATAIADALERRDGIIWVPSVLRWVMTVLRHLPSSIVRKLRT